MQGEERAAEVGELLKGAIEFVGEPLAEAELDEDEKAPGEHSRKNRDRFALEEFNAHQGNYGEGEREEFG